MCRSELRSRWRLMTFTATDNVFEPVVGAVMPPCDLVAGVPRAVRDGWRWMLEDWPAGLGAWLPAIGKPAMLIVKWVCQDRCPGGTLALELSRATLQCARNEVEGISEEKR